jgi:hypothetical protein
VAAGLTPAAQLQFDHITVGGDFTLRGVTIQQYFGAQPRPDSASRNRRAMLEKAWAIWIIGVLQPSLPHDILLELGLTGRPAMVTRALDLYAQRPDLADQLQAPGTRLIDIFDRLDRALLILGAPGAGKTTLLLTLAQDLLIRAAQDPEQPIPVVFPLSSWATQRRPLADWLVDALNEQYDVPRKTGQTWVDADEVLPLLDGLDEVASEHREACVEAINTFRQEHGLLPLVVCSRVADYEGLDIRLRLQGAMVVQPLTRVQVDSYLTQIREPLAAVRNALGDDPTLWELLDTPLMLTIVTLAYAGEPVVAFHASGTLEARRRDLFAAYVDRMFQRRGASTRYTRQQTERWLAWLAWQMTQHDQTVFYLERMQPDWLPPGQRWVPTQGSKVLAGLLGGPLGGLLGWLLEGLAFALGFGLGRGPGEGLFWDLAGGLAGGLLGGLVGGLAGGLVGYSEEIRPIETVRWSWSGFLAELFLLSGRRLSRGWAVGLVGGLLIGLSQGLAVMLSAERDFGLTRWEAWWSDGLSYGLKIGLSVWFGVILVSGLGIGLGWGLGWGLGFGLSPEMAQWLAVGLGFGLIYTLSAGLVAGLSGGEISTKNTPNEGIYRSARMALISGVGSGLGVGLLFVLYRGLRWRLASLAAEWSNVINAGLVVELRSVLSRGLGFGLIYGPLVGLVTGLPIGLKYGGWACLQHLLIRLMLRFNGSAPCQYSDFLDYAAERIFLRKVGGGYSFIHRQLQNYFTMRYVELGGDAPYESAEQRQSAPS